MKVVLGSINEDKREIVEKAYKEIYFNVKVVSVKVNSGITDQPLDRETTKKGAINRAREAKKVFQKADFWLGLEAGLNECYKKMYLITYACLIDPNGNEFIGKGEKISLPDEVSGKIRRGERFGKVIREYSKDHKVDENLITRAVSFIQAIQNAYASYLKRSGNLGYRKKVAAIIIDNKDNFLIDQLVSYGQNHWSIPGGGINEGETQEQAILRELKEELGSDKFKIIGKSRGIYKYEWPSSSIIRRLKMENRTWRGQKAQIFLIKFDGERGDLNLDSNEVRKVKWVKYNKLEDYLVFPGQWRMIESVIKELQS